MEHGGSMPHSEGLSNNPYPEPNQPISYFFKIHSNIFTHVHLGLLEGRLSEGLPSCKFTC